MEQGYRYVPLYAYITLYHQNFMIKNILGTLRNSEIHANNLLYIPIVSGDTNFHMKKTALTVGGFTQPNVAQSLIESPEAIERD